MDVSGTSCSLKDYDYELPEELVAQRPAPERGGSRLMAVDRGSGEIATRRFSEIPALLKPDDCVVLNDTKVIPARLRARKVLGEPDTGTGAQVEVVLLRERDDGAWEALVKRGRRVKAGAKLVFGTRWHATVEEVTPSGARVLRFENDCAWKVIEALGEVPLPPYIERDEPDEFDRERYQTVYARVPGAVAAPTAGLHFTQEMLDAVSAHGISVAYVTLHVSYGTFRPIAAEDISEHQVETEYFKMSAESVKTCARGGSLEPSDGWTDLYIRPPFEFRVVDALLTNFHLPRSSLFVLVCAFAGRELMLEAYERATFEKYRFYSYGDAMLI